MDKDVWKVFLATDITELKSQFGFNDIAPSQFLQ